MMTTFHIDYTQTGFLSSIFFWLYLLVQVPAGILLDYFGGKKVLIPASLFLALGCLLFASAHTYAAAIVARIIMGAGAGFAFIGMVFTIAEYFDFSKFGLMVGLGELVGMAGTSLGQSLAPYLILATSWRMLIYIVAVAVFIITLIMFFFLENRKIYLLEERNLFATLCNSLLAVVKMPAVWFSGFFCLGTFAILTGFTDIWALPFLERVYHLTYLRASQVITWVLVGIAIGGPSIGKLADKLNPKAVASIATLLTFLLLGAVIYYPVFSDFELGVLFFVIGFFGSCYLLAFLFVKREVNETYKGAAIAFCNALALLGAVLFQPITGWLLTKLGTTPVDYEIALAVLPIGLILSLCCIIFIDREKNKKVNA